MLRKSFHLSDEDILLVLDGEVSARRAKQVRAHLAACWSCRARSAELESTIEDFISLHHRALDPELKDVTGARALLKARLSQAAAQPSTELRSRSRLLHHLPRHHAAAYICIALLICLFGGTLLLRRSPLRRSAILAVAAVPDRNLTPGATRPVSIGDVCSMPHEEVVRDVPPSLRQQVFKEYGISNPRPGDYEIDYLIAPGLGGAEDIHNLWPEPADSSAWNAHRKDLLEERLHQLVCAGELDLTTAQKAIASDWITAYKKYFGPGSPQNHYLS